MRRKIIRESRGFMKPGQDIVAAGFAGMAGTLAIVREKREELEQYFSSSYIETIYNKKKEESDRNLEQWKEFGATEWEPAGEGGKLTALWNLSGAYGVGIEFTLRQIPVKQETIEICEYYDLNPYRLYSEGCVLLIANHGGRLTERLKREGIFSVVIGKVNEGAKMEILMEEGAACLDRPQKDELEKVIPGYFQR